MNQRKHLVTGGAGFIGSHLVDRLLEDDNEVVVVDNLSSGHAHLLDHHQDNDRFSFLEGDLLNQGFLDGALQGVDFVHHLAANPDVRVGSQDPGVHLEQNVETTCNLLEAMRKNDVKKISFTSTSTVYGEADEFPTPETYGPLVPISLYGASKLSAEAYITSYCHTFDMQSWIFRFANIIGPRGTHGVIVDFIDKLRANPRELEILGDGRQNKSYLLVGECVDAMMLAIQQASERVNIYNIGSEDWTTVTRIAEIIVEEMGLEDVEFKYTGGERGWAGDVPRMMLDISRIKELGWEPEHGSEEAVRLTARSLLASSN